MQWTNRKEDKEITDLQTKDQRSDYSNFTLKKTPFGYGALT
jgi:hypothetical protein